MLTGLSGSSMAIIGALALPVLGCNEPPSQPPMTGVWRGILVAGEGPNKADYRYAIALRQFGTNVRGFARIEIVDKPTQFGVLGIEGTVEGGVVKIRDTRILSLDLESLDAWCIKNYDLTLRHSQASETLDGPWKSAPGAKMKVCPGGTMSLARIHLEYDEHAMFRAIP